MTTIDLALSETAVSPVASTVETLEQLAGLVTDRPTIISLYVRLQPEDRIRTRYRIAVRDAIRRAVTAVGESGLPHPESEALRRDFGRIEEYLAHAGRLPHAPGMALFVCEGLGLFRVVPLPRVAQTRLLLGTRVRLAEAFAGVTGFGRILVALVDRTHARFFEVTAFEGHELSGLQLTATRGGKYHSDRTDAPGWGEHDFHNRIREERHRRAAEVADQLTALVAQGPCQGIVIAGSARAIVDQLRFLPHSLARLVLGTSRLNPTSATEAEVRAAALEARAAGEQAREAAVVAEMERGIGTGWAENGAGPTLRALARGQVRTLIVPTGQSGAGFRCGLSGRLVLRRAECQGEGDAVPVPDLVSEALEEAFRQHVEVEMIDDPEVRARVDGLGGLLRFR